MIPQNNDVKTLYGDYMDYQFLPDNYSHIVTKDEHKDRELWYYDTIDKANYPEIPDSSS